MPMIQNDSDYLDALTYCSANILKFLQALNEKDSTVQWERLYKDTGRRDNIFKIVSSWRSLKDQITEYKKGRSGVKYDDIVTITKKKFINSVPTNRYELTAKGTVSDEKKVSTNAWAGYSRHNWGLAVDIEICPIKVFGYNTVVNLSDGAMSLQNYYHFIGLDTLAKKCGLSWGGDWTDFVDVWHFEDESLAIPPKEFHYQSNCTAEWLQKYWSGAFDGGEEGTKVKKISALGVGLFLGAFAYFSKKR